MRWPWSRRNRELEEAQNDRERAQQREEEVTPLVRDLHRWDRANHLSARIQRSWLGGQE